jgi:ActD protein
MAERMIAIFETRSEAVAALRDLQREGVLRSSITVMSSEPLHLENKDAPKTRIAGFAIAGALLGAAFAILLTVWTSRRVGLVTGGMPILTPWAFGIIVFELTALGAILSTLGRMIFEAGLARRGLLTDYHAAVADGRVVLMIDCTEADDAQTADDHLEGRPVGTPQAEDEP